MEKVDLHSLVMGSLPSKRLTRFLMAGMWLKWVTLTELYSIRATLPVTWPVKKVCFKCQLFSVLEPQWLTRWLKVSDCTLRFTSQRYVDDPGRSEARTGLSQSCSLQQRFGSGHAEPLQSSTGFKLSQTLHSMATRAAVGKLHSIQCVRMQRNQVVSMGILCSKKQNKPQPNVVLQNI